MERIRCRAFFERLMVLRRFKLLPAQSDTCFKGCHSKLSSGSTSLDASLSLRVVNATNISIALNTAPVNTTSQPGASPTCAL